MLILHCTNKFLDQLEIEPSMEKVVSDRGILGSWSATYFYYNNDKVFLFVNDATLFSFTLRCLTSDIMKIEIMAGLIDSLHRVNVPLNIIGKIRKESDDIIFTKNTNRRVIGSINNLVYLYQYSMQQYRDRYSINMNEIESKMHRVPFKYLSYKLPVDVLKSKLKI